MKTSTFFIVFSGALLLLSSGCGKRQEKAAERVINVVAKTPVERNFQNKIRIQANIEAKEKAGISSLVAGTLDKLNVTDGSVVKKGDLLFQVDHVNLENDVEVQKAKLKVAESDLYIAQINHELSKTISEKAKRDYERSSELYKNKAVSKDAFERNELSFQESEANIRKAEAQANYAKSKLEQEKANLKIVQKKLADSTVFAPFDGVVIEKFNFQGEYVQVSRVLLNLENPNVLELSAYLSAVYYDYITPNVTKVVIFNMDGTVLGESKITYKAPSIDPISRTFKVKSLLPKNKSFVSGMICNADIILNSNIGKGVVAEAIISRNDGSQILFVATPENKAEIVRVKTGILDGKEIEILNIEDLKNRPAIVQGQTFLADGDRINVVNK